MRLEPEGGRGVVPQKEVFMEVLAAQVTPMSQLPSVTLIGGMCAVVVIALFAVSVFRGAACRWPTLDRLERRVTLSITALTAAALLLLVVGQIQGWDLRGHFTSRGFLVLEGAIFMVASGLPGYLLLSIACWFLVGFRQSSTPHKEAPFDRSAVSRYLLCMGCAIGLIIAVGNFNYQRVVLEGRTDIFRPLCGSWSNFVTTLAWQYPHVLWCMTAGLFAVHLHVSLGWEFERRQAIKSGRCPNCWYDLSIHLLRLPPRADTGTTLICCPECGKQQRVLSGTA